MTELEGLIHYWESVHKEFFFLLGPATLVLIQNTIKYLKQIQDKER